MKPTTTQPKEEEVQTPALAKAVRAARERRGWSQGQLAQRSGVSVSNISRIEAGKISKPRWELLLKLATALGADAKFLLFLAGHLSEETMKFETEGIDELDADLLTHEAAEAIRRQTRTDLEATGEAFRQVIARRFVEAAQGEPVIARGLMSVPDSALLDQLIDHWHGISHERRKALVAHSRDQVYLSERDEKAARRRKG